MKIVYPPLRIFTQNKSLFLAGSIEMGKAADWQQNIANSLSLHYDCIYNPRRSDWDSTWIQTIENPNFNCQVNWELDMINVATEVLFYFDPNTQSPISLMELGYCVGTKSPEQVVVCCPEGFWRKGNVDIICNRSGFKTFPTIEQAAYYLRTK